MVEEVEVKTVVASSSVEDVVVTTVDTGSSWVVVVVIVSPIWATFICGVSANERGAWSARYPAKSREKRR